MPVFDNCIIQAPDGVTLSRCGIKKLKWYVSRGLAEQVGDNPPTIRLKFEPRGRDGLDDPLLTDGKPNICVVCGTPEDLTKHHIVPYSFVKHMAVDKKVDVIHDIYPLCRYHHTEYERLSTERRKEMAEAFGVPLYGLDPDDLQPFARGVKSASALLRHGENIPDDRREMLLANVREFLKLDREPTLQELKNAANFRMKDHENYVNFSKHVAGQYEDLEQFAKEWRIHFMETMKPQFMPDNWSVDRGFSAVWIPSRFMNQVSGTDS